VPRGARAARSDPGGSRWGTFGAGSRARATRESSGRPRAAPPALGRRVRSRVRDARRDRAAAREVYRRVGPIPSLLGLPLVRNRAGTNGSGGEGSPYRGSSGRRERRRRSARSRKRGSPRGNRAGARTGGLDTATGFGYHPAPAPPSSRLFRAGPDPRRPSRWVASGAADGGRTAAVGGSALADATGHPLHVGPGASPIRGIAEPWQDANPRFLRRGRVPCSLRPASRPEKRPCPPRPAAGRVFCSSRRATRFGRAAVSDGVAMHSARAAHPHLRGAAPIRCSARKPAPRVEGAGVAEPYRGPRPGLGPSVESGSGAFAALCPGAPEDEPIGPARVDDRGEERPARTRPPVCAAAPAGLCTDSRSAEIGACRPPRRRGPQGGRTRSRDRTRFRRVGRKTCPRRPLRERRPGEPPGVSQPRSSSSSSSTRSPRSAGGSTGRWRAM
jgi:hypothetical protein